MVNSRINTRISLTPFNFYLETQWQDIYEACQNELPFFRFSGVFTKTANLRELDSPASLLLLSIIFVKHALWSTVTSGGKTVTQYATYLLLCLGS